MLPGGNTPFTIYRLIRDNPPKIDNRLHIMLSDERYVPPFSADSNFGRMGSMFSALKISATRVFHPDCELPLKECAEKYNLNLSNYLENGGIITLALLGVGIDGHTASLFDHNSLTRGKQACAIAVKRDDGPDRISVTKNLISRIKRIVFLCAGVEKAGIVEKMEQNPNGVIAARAVENVENVELWYSALT